MAETKVARREMKYLLNQCTASSLKAKIQKVLPIDNYSGSDGYAVRSLYFDTVYDRDFHDKVDGLEIRHKIRLRIYSAADLVAKLEVKKKQGSDQWKYSATIAREDAELMVQGRYEKVLAKYKSPFIQAVLRQMIMESYIPKTIVEFHRLAFTEKTNDTRITFDTSLKASEAGFDLFSPKLHLYAVRYPVIMEVKFNRFLLSHIKTVLQLANQLPVATSKYCLGRQIGLRGGPR